MQNTDNSIPLNRGGKQDEPRDHSSSDMRRFMVRNAAVGYIKEGFAVITYPAGQKNPVGQEWQKRTLTLKQAAALEDGVNLGIITGQASGGLYDVDCDVPQAGKAWEHFGLRTERVHGRPHNPASHHWYRCLDEPDHGRKAFSFPQHATETNNTPRECMYIELRGGNEHSAAQTMVPPSLHPDGELLDWTDDGEPTVVPYAELYQRVALSAAATLLARQWPDKGMRDEAAMALAGGLIRGTDWTDDDIDDFTSFVAQLAHDEEHSDREKAARTREKVEAGRNVWGWPKLAECLVNGKEAVKRLLEWLDIRPGGRDARNRPTVFTRDGISEMESKVLGALARANDPANGEPHIYVRNGQLVRIRYDETHRPIVASLNRAALASEIDALVRFMAHYKGGDTHAVMPPDEVVNAMLQSTRYDLPALTGLSEVPLLRPDGTVLDTPGYDVATGMLYQPVVGATQVPPVSASPRNAEVQAAVKLLDEAIGDFPYATESDRAHAFAALLSPVLRAALGDSLHPMPLFDAPTVGTGKTLLATTISLITIGKHSAVPTPTEEAEWNKVISTTLLQARPITVFDNATGRVDSASLAAVLSSKRYSPRLLGKNDMPDLLNNTIWMITANNLHLSLDIARRTYRVRLDAKMAKPWKREQTGWKHPNLVAWVEQERHRLLHAVLTLARAWYARGKPVPVGGVPAFGGYQEWAKTVGGILAVAGIEGFLSNQDDLWDTADNATEEWETFLSQWYATWGDQPVKTKQVYDAVRDQLDVLHDRFCANPDLRDAVPSELMESLRKGTFAKQLGYALRSHLDTRYGDENYRIVFVGKDRDGTGIWKVVQG